MTDIADPISVTVGVTSGHGRAEVLAAVAIALNQIPVKQD